MANAYNYLSKHNWKRKIKAGIAQRLLDSGFRLVTSILTKTEILKQLIQKENCSISLARTIFQDVLDRFQIVLIASLNKRNLLTNTFMDIVAVSNLGCTSVASKSKLTVVTHDKKFYKASHNDKMKFYSDVVKPSELLNN